MKTFAVWAVWGEVRGNVVRLREFPYRELDAAYSYARENNGHVRFEKVSK